MEAANEGGEEELLLSFSLGSPPAVAVVLFPSPPRADDGATTLDVGCKRRADDNGPSITVIVGRRFPC